MFQNDQKFLRSICTTPAWTAPEVNNLWSVLTLSRSLMVRAMMRRWICIFINLCSAY